MKMYVYGILFILLASIVVIPMVEMAIVYREKIVLDSALRNASRVAKDMSLQRESIQNLDAEIDEDVFIELFTDTFTDVMNVYGSSRIGDTVTFQSYDERYEQLVVTFDFSNYSQAEGVITKVNINATADYIFKTAMMRTAADVNPAIHYQLVTERDYTLQVKN